MLPQYHKPNSFLGPVRHDCCRPGFILVHEAILGQLAECNPCLVEFLFQLVIPIYSLASRPPEKLSEWLHDRCCSEKRCQLIDHAVPGSDVNGGQLVWHGKVHDGC